MKAKINLSSTEHPKIVEGEILFKDNINGGVNNYLVKIDGKDILNSIHRNQIINLKELSEYYAEKNERKQD